MAGERPVMSDDFQAVREALRRRIWGGRVGCHHRHSRSRDAPRGFPGSASLRWEQPSRGRSEATSKYKIDITARQRYALGMSRKATTYRIDPIVQTGLSTLSRVLGRPQNQLVNEAVRDFVARRSREVEADLEATLEALRAYRKSDPNFERAIEDYVDAEASLKEDPAEGQRAEGIGTAQKRVLELLND
jgi:predicted transcriptional regulator